MAIDGKYGRVQTERGTIGDDEPVVVFRAQDRLLPQVLSYYETICRHEGSPERHLNAIKSAWITISAWQETHATKIPTSDGWTNPAGIS